MDSAEQASISSYHDINYKINDDNTERKLENTFSSNSIPNRHFDNLLVNFSTSSIVVSHDIDSLDVEVQNVINWSENLNAIFINNYDSDPSLSWQYFGSSTGFSRTYPANIKSFIAQNEQNPDFRTSAWYVNAVTSPKDIVILIDNSGSMTGSHSKLARHLIIELIDTLNVNDFVNIFKFSQTTEELIPCYKNMLLQANYENKRILKDALHNLDPENVANFSSALIKSFELLQKYNRSGQGSQCNQAIMLITDDITSDYRDVFKMYNWPHIPVRVFTYLVGSDYNNWKYLKWIACNNKGYFSHISNAKQIKKSVLKYINVMARPLILYHNYYPIAWTPILFTKKKVANLLGVVGTDVLIDEIKKLIPPFKLGVNGYVFIVDNNGHILDHPNLRTHLDENSNSRADHFSVDLTEVEFMENEILPRENNSYLTDLRNDMIDQKEGETEFNAKIPYDNMRRIFKRKQKYFYRSIENTPFSLGLVLPNGFGLYEVIAEQEIKHAQINVTEFFIGKNWRIHPSWVYCEYNNEAKMNQLFKSPEEKILHFLIRTYRPGWKWMSLRPRFPSNNSNHKHIHINKIDKKSHYCDKNLVQSLVFDAIITNKIEQYNQHSIHSQDRHQGYKMFGLTRSFISTRSGLFRWTDHNSLKDDNLTQFIQEYSNSIEGTWYQRAVDYHKIEQSSFVFSVPFAISDNPSGLVTAIHAIFVGTKGHRVPMAVVGLQFQHTIFASHFLNITSVCMTSTVSCSKTCSSDDLDCYVLDDNGYVIISENNEHTGTFFGEVDGTIMDSLVQDKVYKKTELFDYQSECNVKGGVYGSSANIQIQHLWTNFSNWFCYNCFIFVSMLKSIYMTLTTTFTDSVSITLDKDYKIDEEYSIDEDNHPNFDYVTMSTLKNNYYSYYNKHSDHKKIYQKSLENSRLCDKKIDLYELQSEKLHANGKNHPLKGKLTNCHKSGCEKAFSVQKIPHSNLILLVVDTLCPCGNKQFSISAKEIFYTNSMNNTGTFQNYLCYQNKKKAYRRRPSFCSNYHPEEIEINTCSSSMRKMINIIEIIILMVLTRQF